ncbi:MAG: ACP S-malonyltransferase [Deltaproteobacteria bacterium]
MSRIAFLFPGQGAQYAGMGKDLCEAYPEAARVFAQADEVLGFRLSRLCFEGPAEELTRTENCQPAIFTVSIACLEVFRALRPELTPDAVAGLSLGEYAALVAAGVLGFRDAVTLVRARGAFMEACSRRNPGTMSCVLGLDKEAVAGICAAAGCEIANLNCPEQVVISGRHEAVAEASRIAAERGAKRVIPLEVSGAFHCSLMDEASRQLKAQIERVKFDPARIPLVSNVDALPQRDPAVLKANLIKQVNGPTYWEASMRLLLAEGITTFFEIGPGTVLKGLMKKIDRQASVISLGRAEEIGTSAKAPLA